jgi:starch synthase
MNVVVVATEAVPFAKTGGLGDVMGALPRALDALGVTVSLILPLFRSARDADVPLHETVWELEIPVGSETVRGRVLTTPLPGSRVTTYLVDQPGYFDREHLYQEGGKDYPDNASRFTFFDRAAVEVVRRLRPRPEVVHANDWQTGLVPVYLRESAGEGFAGPGTLMTVHNMAYQGVFPPEDLRLTGLDPSLFDARHLEFRGHLDFLKAGLVYADLLSTVSPTYAREVQTPEYGCGLDAVLRARRDDLRGIVNGIDPDRWSPARGQGLACPYDVWTYRAGKAACKADLQRRAGLPVRAGVPLLAQIGRLDPQKGWDLLAGVADDLLRRDVQMVVLGEGQPRYHELLERLAGAHPDKLRVVLEFSDEWAHRIEAGADLFLMPSLYEPCGLNQLYSLAYGTIPVVRATGGLADTVVDATPRALADGSATGFAFLDPTPGALEVAVDRALALWADRDAWHRLVVTAMQADWSWDRSARGYLGLYEEVRRRAAERPRGQPARPSPATPRGS